eukprot:4531819-Pleurochrysis_carterae.AAC.1
MSLIHELTQGAPNAPYGLISFECTASSVYNNHKIGDYTDTPMCGTDLTNERKKGKREGHYERERPLR